VRAAARTTLALAVVVSLSACASPHSAVVAKATPTARPVTYVAIGSSDSIGAGSTDPLLYAWTQVFYRTALPRSAVFFNLAEPDATAAQALQDQVPVAVGLSPTVVTVSLGMTDLFDGVAASTYGAQLRQMINALRGRGTTLVLVANTPPLAQLPAYRACLPGTPSLGPTFTCPDPVPSPATLDAEIASYNAITASEVPASGAILVDLHAAGIAAEQRGTAPPLIGEDGVDPSDAGHAQVARAFASALTASGQGPRLTSAP
jgi:lysophospholipase L1-like esterase